MFKADFIQHLNFDSSPTGNSLLACAVPHLFESLGDTVLNVLPSLVMPDRNVVDVQMWRGFVHVQDSVKNVEVGIAILETFHVLFQAICNELKVLGAITRIFLFADLHHVLIEAFTLVGCGADCITRFDTKEVFVVAAVNLAIVTLLFCVITLGGFLEKLVVCFAYRLTHEGDVLRSAERINIVRHELPVIMSQRTLSLTERYSFLFHFIDLSFHWIYFSLSTKSNQKIISINSFHDC